MGSCGAAFGSTAAAGLRVDRDGRLMTMAGESSPRFYRDSYGHPRAEFVGELEPLGVFLEQDVQSSATHCSELIDLVAAVEDRRVSHDERTGNAYILTATHGVFFLQNLYDEDEPVLRLRPDDFRQALAKWLALIGGEDEGGSEGELRSAPHRT